MLFVVLLQVAKLNSFAMLLFPQTLQRYEFSAPFQAVISFSQGNVAIRYQLTPFHVYLP